MLGNLRAKENLIVGENDNNSMVGSTGRSTRVSISVFSLMALPLLALDF